MKSFLAVAVAFAAVAAAPEARADYTVDFVYAECDPQARYFSARLETMNSQPAPAGDAFIDVSAGVELAPEGDFSVVRAGAERVLFSCRFDGQDRALQFEVRRTGFLPAHVRMCRGIESADIEIALNGVVIDRWPGAYPRCVAMQSGAVGPSVSYRGYFVRRCARSVDVEATIGQGATETQICRSQTPADVLAEGAPAP